MNIQLSEHFTYKKLLRFTLPSIAMMIFISIYSVVDGYFVSNFVGKTPFAAVNFIWPFLGMLSCLGFMFGAGGSALIAKTMGEGKPQKAKELFTLFIAVLGLLSVAIAVLGYIFLRPAAVWLGAEGELLENSLIYGRILLLALPAYTLQFAFQSFFVTAEKPQLGLVVTLIAGGANMLLDALLTAVFPLGLKGAAIATAVSQTLGGLIPLIYFARNNSSLLRFVPAKYDGRALFRACANGSSELMSNISMSLVGMLYNIQLLKYAQENGVAAYGTLMYVTMVFLAVFIGYSVGTAPIISFHYGAQNHGELKSLLKKSLVIIGISSVGMVIFAEVLAKPLSLLFVGYDETLFSITLRGFFVYSFSFLFSGVAIFGSSFFTALNNGPVSALISFLRTMVFQIAAVLIFPLIWGLDGIWLSVVAAELMAVAVTVVFLFAMRKRYRYF